MTDAMLFFTGKSKETTLQVGGTQSWVLDRSRARKARYAVLARNTSEEWSEGTEPHGMGFMVGRISDIVHSTETEGRWLVTFDEYALIEKPDLWPGLRNPVHYTTLESLDIDLTSLHFEPMPTPRPPAKQVAIRPSSDQPLTISEAKIRLAITFGVEPEAIEITVRG